MAFVVSTGVAEIDAAGEGDVAFGLVAVPNHHQFLMVRAAEAHPLVEKHLASRSFDRLTEMLVLLLAVRELVQMRTPYQPLDDDTAFGRFAQQFPDGGSAVAHLLVRVAAPVGEEHIVAFAERLN